MSAPVRVVVVTGAPGVGKTTVARLLSRRYSGPCALVDTDWLSCIRPWSESELLYDLIADNLAFVLDRHRQWGAQTLVLSGVVLPGRLLPRLDKLLADARLHWVFYGLRARQDTIKGRIGGFSDPQDPGLRGAMSHLDAEVADVPGVRQVQTDRLTVEEVVSEICAHEARDGAAVETPAVRRPAPATAFSEVPAGIVRDLAYFALSRRGVPPRPAHACVEALCAAQTAGLASHGLIRLPEYCRALDRGELDARARPETTRLGPASLLVRGRKSLGVLTVEAARDALLETGRGDGPGVVALRDGGHLGRLGDIVRPAAWAGLVVVGFVNYSGTGQKVAPAGTGTGRIATNPIVFGCPAPDGPPVVADLSTSAWSEGAVRVAASSQESLPDGVLVDRKGHAVYDAALLYDRPAEAALAPLGTGPAGTGHKGYALAVMVELMAGALAGAGVSRAPAPDGTGGNGGLFIVLRPEYLGRSEHQLSCAVRDLEAHLSTAEPMVADRPARLPGRGRARPPTDTFTLPHWLLTDLERCADRATPRYSPTEG